MNNRKANSFLTSLNDDGLRTKFRPRTRISSIFLHLIPWLNLIALAILFIIVSDRISVDPAISFELPQGTFREGSHNTLNLVMLRPSNTNEMPLVFFDEVRYKMQNPVEMQNLASAISAFAQKSGTRQILLLADGEIRHADVIRIVNIARDSGISKINVGIKPE